ncbi:sensor histidine kinase [Paenibacillus sp. SYP-B4298]|uniref:sensor histidine kinase n=1 Tax=Paenibacillus sp. SYP-B4298 TaxID=2996034 RepID=UPI0022DD2866|nr:histidine kinase [Paenibacillus sp. SYP-B4298]
MLHRTDFSLRNTIFLRMLVTFLLVMLPILLFGAYLYHWIVQTASEDLTKTAASQLEFYLSDLENEVERMKLLQYSLLEDENLNKLALMWGRMETIEKTDTMNSLMNRLFTVQNSSMYIKDVSVHIASIGRTLSADDGVRNLQAERFYAIRSVFGAPSSHIIEWNGGLYLGAAKQAGVKGAQPLFTVEIELDNTRLQEALSQFNTYPGSGTLLLSGSRGVSLASATGELRQLDMKQHIERFGGMEPLAANRLELSGKDYYTVMARSERLEMAIYRLIPEQVVQQPLQKFYVWAWLFAIATIVIIAAFALSTYMYIHKPMLTLVKSFRRMENGDLDVHISHESKDEFRYLYGRFNQMVANLRSLIDQAYKQKILAQKAELKQLQSQINPHFLYNSFFILNTMVRTGDMERIEQFTTLLGEYFQFVTRNASDTVTLEQEIHHARMYAEIQELRFSRRVQVRFDPLPPALRPLTVPRLIVQPIIENAFKYSLERKAKGGRMIIRFEHQDGEARIIVEDNGETLSDEELTKLVLALQQAEEQAETTGLVNIHRRLLMTFGGRGGLRLARSELGGLEVTIAIPAGGGETNVQDADRG